MMADNHPSLRGNSSSERMVWLLSLVIPADIIMAARFRGAEATCVQRGVYLHEGVRGVVTSA